MSQKKTTDWQTLSIFLFLGALTVIFVLGAKMVLFAPSLNRPDLKPVEARTAP